VTRDRKDVPIGTSPRVRDQPSLTTSTGRSWLLLGGLLSLIAVGILIPMLPLEPAGVALIGICVVVALYTGMIVARLNVRPGRPMLAFLATFMIAIAVVGLVCVGVIAASQSEIVF
jgi:O-antigen/teichoic acid export membrane protein